jgi:hypothetical protein
VRQPHRSNRRGHRTGFQVAHQFVVTQGAKSIEYLQTMQQHFGVGRMRACGSSERMRTSLHVGCCKSLRSCKQ